MKSDQIVLLDKRTNIRVDESEGEIEESEKMLGLFDENSYREDEILLTRTNISFKTAPENWLIFSLFLTRISKHRQLGET